MNETPHNKLRKMLEMLIMLSNSKYGREKSALAEHFGISEKTVSRYINTFREIGFVIDKNDGCFIINKQASEYKDLSELLHFSEDESYILSKAINAIDTETGLKEQLKAKLYSLYNFDRVATPIVQKHNRRIIEKLSTAITEKRQTELIKYRSANSDNVENRITEPFDFTRNYVSVWAYEPESDLCKTFKISRITNVKILERPQAFKEKHRKRQLDAFRMAGDEEIMIKLSLSLKAYNLLTEEYPRAEAFCQKQANGTYLFEAAVYSLYGVGRFVLGLPEDVQVLAPQMFKDFLNARIRNKKF
jgi:proteasome accessory factor C